jgi:hypothetical protein
VGKIVLDVNLFPRINTYFLHGETWKVKDKLKALGYKFLGRWWATNISVEKDPLEVKKFLEKELGVEIELSERLPMQLEIVRERLRELRKSTEIVKPFILQLLQSKVPTIARYARVFVIRVPPLIGTEYVDKETFKKMLEEAKKVGGGYDRVSEGFYIRYPEELMQKEETDDEFRHAIQKLLELTGGVVYLKPDPFVLPES